MTHGAGGLRVTHHAKRKMDDVDHPRRVLSCSSCVFAGTTSGARLFFTVRHRQPRLAVPRARKNGHHPRPVRALPRSFR